MDSSIPIKPHHFVDIITRLGEPEAARFEPHPYGHGVQTVAAQILDDPNVLLRIELGSDAICAPCCHNVDGMCDDTIEISFRPRAPESKQAYNLLIDRRWCERLELRQNDQLTARQFCLRIQDRAGDLEAIYRESPAARTTARQSKLYTGVVRFLNDSSSNNS